MHRVSVSDLDMKLVTQPVQKHYLLVEVLSSNFQRLACISGDVISCNISISSEQSVRRTASISMKTDKKGIEAVLSINMTNYIRLSIGIEDNENGNVTWYTEGIFIINKNGVQTDATSMSFSMELSDMMYDLTGDRRGTIHAYTSIVKNQQTFEEVMTDLIGNDEFGGIKDYDIEPIHAWKNETNFLDESPDDDYLIPYDMKFEVGLSIYDILEKLVTCYPDWEIFFDSYGTFVCQSKLREQDTSAVVMDDTSITPIRISDSLELFDASKIKNVIEIWGKGGDYYGEARCTDDTNPYAIAAVGELREVLSGGNYEHIYDRYKDIEKEKEIDETIAENEEKITRLSSELSKMPKETEEQRRARAATRAKIQEAQGRVASAKRLRDSNIKITGNDMAQQWAESLLDDKTRLQYTSTLTLLLCPFLNETGFKVSYTDSLTEEIRTFVVTGVQHDYLSGTTTLTCCQFDTEGRKAMYTIPGMSIFWNTVLSAPAILSYNVEGLNLTVTASTVPHAETYALIINGHTITTKSTPDFSYTFTENQASTYQVAIKAMAMGFTSATSEIITVDIIGNNTLITSSGEPILTSDGKNIIII